VVIAERLREHTGHERRDDAVAERDPDAEPDQGEHVEATIRDRPGEPHVERPRRPRTHRSGKRELGPDARAPVEERHAEHLAHHDREQRDREHGRKQEAPPHVDEFGIGTLVERGHHRLEGHAADRAVAGTVAHDLRMHRARVLRSGGCGRSRLGLRLHVRGRIGHELVLAAGAAEQDLLSVVCRAVLGVRRHGHAADRILDRGLAATGPMGVVVRVLVMGIHGDLTLVTPRLSFHYSP
jgi:hypothetical protein